MNYCFVSREFSGSCRRGGIKTYLETVVGELVKEKHRVVVICARDNRAQKASGNTNLKIIRLPMYDYYDSSTGLGRMFSLLRGFAFYNIYRLLVLFSFFSENRKTPFDVVEIPDYGAEAKYIFRFSHLFSCKKIVRLHGMSCMHDNVSNRKQWRPLQWLKDVTIRDEFDSLCAADVVSSPSVYMKNFLLEREIGVLASDIRVIPNPMVEEIFKSSSFCNANHNDSNIKKVGYVGTVSEIKGVKLLVESIVGINASSNFDVELMLAGRITGDMVAYMSSLDLPFLNYVGVLEQCDIVNMYLQVDVVVVPSYREPFGLVALEAMRVNGLVLVSDAGALPEIVISDENGFIFESGSSLSLTSKLIYIFGLSRGEVFLFRKRAHAYVERFRVKHYCKALKILVESGG